MAQPGRPQQQDPDIDLLISMLRFSAMISRPMRDGVADPAGLSSNELRILIALSGEREAAGHDLAELMGMQAMNVSRALSSLHTMGLVEPAADRANRRRKPHRLSKRGAAAHVALAPRIAAVSEFLFGTLTGAERSSLAEILVKLDRQVRTWKPSETHPHVPRA